MKLEMAFQQLDFTPTAGVKGAAVRAADINLEVSCTVFKESTRSDSHQLGSDYT